MDRNELELKKLTELKKLAYNQGFTHKDADEHGDARKRSTWIDLLLLGSKAEEVIDELQGEGWLDDPANENEELRLLDVEGYRSSDLPDSGLYNACGEHIDYCDETLRSKNLDDESVLDAIAGIVAKVLGPDVVVKPWLLGKDEPEHLEDIQQICPCCDGGGWVVSDSGNERCDDCGGTGLILPTLSNSNEQLSPFAEALYSLTDEAQAQTEPKLSQDLSQNAIASDLPDGFICPNCKGRGRVINYSLGEWVLCSDCNGTGRLRFDIEPEDIGGLPKHDAKQLETLQENDSTGCQLCNGTGYDSDGGNVFACVCNPEPDLIERVNTFMSAVRQNELSSEQIIAVRAAVRVSNESDEVLSEILQRIGALNLFTPGQLLAWAFDQVIPQIGFMIQFNDALQVLDRNFGEPAELAPPEPGNYPNLESFKADYDTWLQKISGSDDESADIAWAEAQFTSAEELWEQQEKVSPFSNGEEYLGWTRSNCHNCEKAYHQCDIADELLEGTFSDGLVIKNIFKRMGERSGTCTEFTPCKSKQLGSVLVGASEDV